MLEAMESLEVMDNGVESCNGGMESLEFRRNGFESCNGGLGQVYDSVGSDNPDVEILEDFDSYMQEVDDRLIISRVVSDSVIKGMVNALREEAAEEIAAVREEAAKKIAQKEQEVTKFKEMLHIYHMGVDENEFLGSSVLPRELNGTQHRLIRICSKDGMQHPSSLEVVTGHDRIAETLVHLRETTNKEFKKLKKEIDSIRGCTSMKRISSSSGLGDILQDKVSDRWDVNRTLDSLETTIETVYQQVDEMVASVNEWQLDQELKDNIEALVMANSVEKNTGECSYGEEVVNWHERKKEISGIRDELDAISKSLSVSDNGQLSSHGSLEVEQESIYGKKGAGSHSKVLNNIKSASSLPSTVTTTEKTLSSLASASSSSSLWEENGIHDESEIKMEEDSVLLKHLSTEGLMSHYHNVITKLKRNHELKVQDLTEKHFGHMRELLRERRPSLTLKKNKEFDMLKKRISVVISKVDEILVEKEEVATLLPRIVDSNKESLNSLNGRLESLLSENHKLRESLEDKKREIECLSLLVSEAAENLSQYSLAEAKLLKTAESLKTDKEDADTEALICEDLFACIIREVVDEIICIAEESQVENSIMHEIYRSKLKEGFHEAVPATNCEMEDLNMEFIITQDLCGVVYKDALEDAEEKLNELNIKYIDEYKLRISQEMEIREKEKQLELEVANKVRLQQEVLFLGEEKEQLARDAAAALANEKERYELAAQEVGNLRGEMCQHQRLISERVEESNAVKRDLVEAFEQNERHKADICKLEQKLEAAVKEFREVEEDRRTLLDVNQEKQTAVSLFEAKERELNKQFESIATYVSGLLKTFTDFECRVTRDISGECSRLKSLTSQSHLLKQKADVLVRRGLLYKQRFEKKCSDLEKAEAEVDLLGDEVDTLLNLVEKIYIALDHYSPILQHYPGITEILKLVRKELSAEIRSA